MKLEFPRQIFGGKRSDIKFSENPSSWSRVPCGQTDMTKLIVAFRSFAETPKNKISMWSRKRLHCLWHEEEDRKKMMMRTWRRGHLQSVLLVLFVWHRRNCSELLSRNCNFGVFLARSQPIHVMKVTLLYRELPKLVYTIVFCSWEAASFPFSV